MGFFSSSPASPTAKAQAQLSSDGTPIAPNRTERSKCWEARDGYFQCLDKHDIVDSIKEGEKAGMECSVEGKAFEANCASSWVQYFKKRRVMEYQKAKTLAKLAAEGAEELPPGVALPGAAGPPR